ncbi:hypothetical protein NDU88_000015 [Pleurodeles waltl]|uniref:Uncharacterized protein n=1 Tax=Pleurodeles waltl TaxID=8319 RepID=A0AAV7R4B9_PLEWA|nr:hypothetical protein NDU88_000015 [Pleurodeles waltl]
MFPPDYIYLRSKVPKLRPIDSTRIPSAVKSRKCDVFRAIYTDVKECTSLDTRYHGGGLMELVVTGRLAVCGATALPCFVPHACWLDSSAGWRNQPGAVELHSSNLTFNMTDMPFEEEEYGQYYEDGQFLGDGLSEAINASV